MLYTTFNLHGMHTSTLLYTGDIVRDGLEEGLAPALPGRSRGMASYSFGRLGALTRTLKRRRRGIVDPLRSIAWPKRTTDARLSAKKDLPESTRMGRPCLRPPTAYGSPGMTDDLGRRHH